MGLVLPIDLSPRYYAAPRRKQRSRAQALALTMRACAVAYDLYQRPDIRTRPELRQADGHLLLYGVAIKEGARQQQQQSTDGPQVIHHLG